MKRCPYLVLLVALTLAACQPRPQPLGVGQRLELGLANKGAAPAELFHTQTGEVAVIPIDVVHHERIGDSPEAIAYVTLDGTWKQLRLERMFKCDYRITYIIFQRLADGRLGLLGDCFRSAPQRGARYLLAHDEAQQTTELLVPEMLPIDIAGWASWDPTLTRAIVSFGSLYSGMYWIDAAGAAAPVTATIQADGKRFSLETAFVAYLQHREVVERTGNAKAPVWSPDGSTIAFFASVAAINREGMHRIRSDRWVVCLMDARTQAIRVALNPVYGVTIPRWSSDGRFLALSGRLGAHGPKGVWVYAVANGATRLIAEGEFGNILWSADDQAIYAIRYHDKNYRREQTEVWRYEVGEVLSALNNDNAAR